MIVGIDLGTTNSLVAVWQDGKSHIIPNALGHNLTPSVVSVDDGGGILVGLAARDRLLTHPSSAVATFKRFMGSNREVALGKKKVRPEELSSFVLRALKADAEAFLGTTVSEAVITVPAYFSDAQRKATRVAGQLAGLTVERLLNEPTAAALAYGLHQRGAESKFLVFDLGGGTFDVSVLELFEGVMEVRASAGDNFLGGEDFVELMIDAFMTEVAAPAGIEAKPIPPQIYQQLRDQAEKAKRTLSQSNSASMHLTYKGHNLDWTISADRLVEISAPLLSRLRVPVERALRDASIRANELDNIVLAGGATRMPIVRALVTRMFGRFPTLDINPDEVVALGAAVQAGLKQRDAALDEVVMTDVCPYTLGIEISEYTGVGNQFRPGHYLPIIDRNVVVPTSRSRSITTIVNYQRELRVRIFQGESRLVRDNIFLGEIHMSVPPRPAGEISCDVRFTYDVNGLLEVETTLPDTGKKTRLVIEENPGVLTQEEIKQRLEALSALKIHPRDDTPNRTLMARADRLYEQLVGDARDFVGRQILQFTQILERQDPREIAEARVAFNEQLDRIEGAPYL